MSGCLIFHRPLICSMTSLESIRTWRFAFGSISSAFRMPAMRPRYSATLFDAIPDVGSDLGEHLTRPGVDHDGAAARDARISPRTAVGLHDQFASSHQSPDSPVRTRIALESGTQEHVVRCRGADSHHVALVEFHTAGRGHPAAQQ